MGRWRFGAVLAFGLAVPCASPAHHSVAGQFNVDRTVELSGIISRVDWINPHIYVYLDVSDADGKVTTWRLETLPTAMARKAGLTRSMLMGDGAPVTVKLNPARDGTRHLGYIIRITYADGHHYQFAEDKTAAAGE